jgi:RNase P subunit RPR2
MQWSGKWKEVNTYCTAPEPADFACRSCHVSTGKVSNLTVNDTDCLICHNDTYKRALGPQTNQVTVMDWTGANKTYNFPIKVNGDYQFQPRYDLMPAGTTMLSLAQNVQKPTRLTCLNCHAKAGGGDGVKRGDLAMENVASTNANLDVHMDADGANLTCQSCHVPNNHLIPGKGVDLRVSEGGTVTCQQCHTTAPHTTNAELNEHTTRVACQTCHIPRFAKATVGTELSRDWTTPHWNPAGCNGQGAWIGEEVKGYNVVPTYQFWNGQSDIYNFGETIAPESGVYDMAKALGSINDGKLYPMKVHTSVQPLHNASNRIVQYDVLWQFMTGKYEEAATRGVTFMGLSGPYSWVTTSADQLITHGVEPKENALQCAACHDTNTQMNLQSLGYTLKAPVATVCSQCHREKRYNGDYVSFHNRHVDTRRNDCSWCHSFSRPERGLTVDPTP